MSCWCSFYMLPLFVVVVVNVAALTVVIEGGYLLYGKAFCYCLACLLTASWPLLSLFGVSTCCTLFREVTLSLLLACAVSKSLLAAWRLLRGGCCCSVRRDALCKANVALLSVRCCRWNALQVSVALHARCLLFTLRIVYSWLLTVGVVVVVVVIVEEVVVPFVITLFLICYSLVIVFVDVPLLWLVVIFVTSVWFIVVVVVVVVMCMLFCIVVVVSCVVDVVVMSVRWLYLDWSLFVVDRCYLLLNFVSWISVVFSFVLLLPIFLFVVLVVYIVVVPLVILIYSSLLLLFVVGWCVSLLVCLVHLFICLLLLFVVVHILLLLYPLPSTLSLFVYFVLLYIVVLNLYCWFVVVVVTPLSCCCCCLTSCDLRTVIPWWTGLLWMTNVVERAFYLRSTLMPAPVLPFVPLVDYLLLLVMPILTLYPCYVGYCLVLRLLYWLELWAGCSRSTHIWTLLSHCLVDTFATFTHVADFVVHFVPVPVLLRLTLFIRSGGWLTAFIVVVVRYRVRLIVRPFVDLTLERGTYVVDLSPFVGFSLIVAITGVVVVVHVRDTCCCLLYLAYISLPCCLVTAWICRSVVVDLCLGGCCCYLSFSWCLDDFTCYFRYIVVWSVLLSRCCCCVFLRTVYVTPLVHTLFDLHFVLIVLFCWILLLLHLPSIVRCCSHCHCVVVHEFYRSCVYCCSDVLVVDC